MARTLATQSVGASVNTAPLIINRSAIDEIIEPSGFDGDFDRCAFNRGISDIDPVATMVNL